jgi:hypothetical protein
MLLEQVDISQVAASAEGPARPGRHQLGTGDLTHI